MFEPELDIDAEACSLGSCRGACGSSAPLITTPIQEVCVRFILKSSMMALFFS
jgi:hypothetical protein